MLDGEGNLVYKIPENDNYIDWAGYNESAHVCRVTGPVGIVEQNSSS
jgi:hypothetical protein